MSDELQPPSTRAAERLAVIVDAAERAALKVIDDAEKEAKRYLDEARTRADRIVADRLREEADRLEGGELGGSRSPRVENQLEIDAEEEDGAEPQSPLAVAEAEAESEEVAPPDDEEGDAQAVVGEEEAEARSPLAAAAPPQPSGTGGGSAAARLLATQMAVSGSSRKEIEARLRNGFEIEDTSEILDAILGPEE